MLSLYLFAVVAPALACQAGDDEPGRPIEVVVPKGGEIISVGINGNGDVIGFDWVEEEERPGVVAQVPFLARGGDVTYLPLLEGFTSTFPAAVSDDGLVVGRVSKPMDPNRRVDMLNQAFVWDAESGIRGLGVLEGDTSSFATGVSSDGSRIGGFSVGPNRVRPCVWDREGDGWNGVALPVEDRLSSNVVAISDDGKHVAAVDGTRPCLWSMDDSGDWVPEFIGEAGSLIPRAVNNAGTVVGLRYDGDGMPHAAAWSFEAGSVRFEEPEGYVKSEAFDVNNSGIIVGMIDGPAGSLIGPDPFVIEDETLRLIVEGGPNFSTAHAINDRGQVVGITEDGAPGDPGSID